MTLFTFTILNHLAAAFTHDGQHLNDENNLTVIELVFLEHGRPSVSDWSDICEAHLYCELFCVWQMMHCPVKDLRKEITCHGYVFSEKKPMANAEHYFK